MALRLYNPEDYGSKSEEDRRLFFAVQFSLYLSSKKSGISSTAEKDMIEDLLSVYWEELDKSGILDGKSPGEKIMICREMTVYFPFTEIPDYLVHKSYPDC